ncbi:MAG: hypothetical protein WDW38_010657 [Sanguina aurantia]
MVLFLVHASGAKAKSAVEFMHISKSGGTSMCHTAELNGCKSWGFDDARNCLAVLFDDELRWVDRQFLKTELSKIDPRVRSLRIARFGRFRNSAIKTCAGRVRYLRKRGWNFYSNEYTPMGGERSGHDSFRHVHLCKQLLNVLLLREPVSRTLSHMDNILQYFVSYLKPFHKAYLEGRDAAFWAQMAPAPLDNYMTRSMLGDVAFNLPVGALQETHMQAARLVLQQYDVLLQLSALPEVTRLGFTFGMAWQVFSC